METRAGGRILVVAVAFAAAVALTSGAPSAVAQQAQSPTPIYLSPAAPTEGEPFLVEADLVVPGGTAAGTVDLDDQQDIILEITTIITSPEPPGSLRHFEWSVPAVPAGIYTLEISSAFVGLIRQGIAVRPRTAQLGLVGKRFQVSVTDTQGGACVPFTTCPTRTYTNPPDTNQNFIDVAAF